MNKQITEDYVSFETAKLLKEKGFDIPCRQAYFNGSLVDYTMYGFCDGELLDCPSQSLALKWLREVHNITIDIEWEHLWYVYVKPMTANPSEKDCYQYSSDKYEEAVEAVCLYVLKNLI